MNGECISTMANGQKWQNWMNIAIACPKEMPFETIIAIGDKEFICKDRGGRIIKEGDYYWIDQLTVTPYYSFGEIVKGTMY